MELRKLAYQLAVKLRIDIPDGWTNRLAAGRTWYYSFIARHPQLSLRTPENTIAQRIEAFCQANVDTFFGQLSKIVIANWQKSYRNHLTNNKKTIASFAWRR